MYPAIATMQTVTKARHRFVGTACLFLIVVYFPLFTFATREQRLDHFFTRAFNVCGVRFFEPLLSLALWCRADQPEFGPLYQFVDTGRRGRGGVLDIVCTKTANVLRCQWAQS